MKYPQYKKITGFGYENGMSAANEMNPLDGRYSESVPSRRDDFAYFRTNIKNNELRFYCGVRVRRSPRRRNRAQNWN
jgi:hypothetical protein